MSPQVGWPPPPRGRGRGHGLWSYQRAVTTWNSSFFYLFFCDKLVWLVSEKKSYWSRDLRRDGLLHPGVWGGGTASGPTRELLQHEFLSFFLFFRQIGLIGHWEKKLLIMWPQAGWPPPPRGRGQGQGLWSYQRAVTTWISSFFSFFPTNWSDRSLRKKLLIMWPQAGWPPPPRGRGQGQGLWSCQRAVTTWISSFFSFFPTNWSDRSLRKKAIDHVTSGGMASSILGSGAGGRASGPARELLQHEFLLFFLLFFRQISPIGHWEKSYWSRDLRRDGLLHPGVWDAGPPAL